MAALLDLLRQARVLDLGQPFVAGMPRYPTHPPFVFGRTKRHGDSVRPGGVSSAGDAFSLGGHTGTHIDALCHYSVGGRLHGGLEAEPLQLTVDTLLPIIRRGVLLDVAAAQGVEALPDDFEIEPAHLEAAQKVAVEAGDVVLLRTGWGRFWAEPERYVNGVRGPGPAEAGARWLSERHVYAAGSDTLAFEKVPSETMPAHRHLLVESGIYILENLNLEELAQSASGAFVLVALPLKIRGGTGSPLRPVALV